MASPRAVKPQDAVRAGANRVFPWEVQIAPFTVSGYFSLFGMGTLVRDLGSCVMAEEAGRLGWSPRCHSEARVQWGSKLAELSRVLPLAFTESYRDSPIRATDELSVMNSVPKAATYRHDGRTGQQTDMRAKTMFGSGSRVDSHDSHPHACIGMQCISTTTPHRAPTTSRFPETIDDVSGRGMIAKHAAALVAHTSRYKYLLAGHVG